jgi:hypothetical protein
MFSIAYSKISVKTDIVLPYKFMGSTIRGAIGWQLKRVVCINPKMQCNGCFAKDNCLYYNMYEISSPKFRLSLDLDNVVNFEVFLFEDIKEKAPYLIAAIYKVLKEKGIARDKIKANFLEIKINNEIAYDEEFKEIKTKFLIFKPSNYSKNIYLKIKTPIRIKENNKFVRNDIKLETILRSIWHRYCKLKNQEITKLPFIPEYKIKNKNFSFLDFTRKSNRQKTKMKLGGIIGFMDLEVDENSYKFLKLGEIIGVGKQVTFGLGNIKVYDENFYNYKPS